MRLVFVSDTHGQHEEHGVLEADLLVHCGDLCGGARRGEEEIARLDDWFSRQRAEQILVVGGNNDLAVQRRLEQGRPAFRHARVLQDEAVEVGGLRIYGSPWVPDLAGMAYYADTAELKRRWAAIPDGLDLLITHTPPAGVLDRSSSGQRLGCRQLARAVAARAPRVHAFGHVHASYGTAQSGGTTFINASSLARGQPRLRPPVVLELDARAPARPDRPGLWSTLRDGCAKILA